MKYRKFGSLDFEVSALGFGAMRMPTDDEGNIKEQEAIDMIRYSVDNGVNYIDTAWPYHDKKSEPLVAKALKDGYRDKVKVATKLPSWEIEEYEDMDKYLDKQLEKLEIDSIDFYLLHALNQDSWDEYKEVDVFKWMEKVKKEGKVKHIGFSFHGSYEAFENIIDDYDGWDFCQIQYNYLDTEFQAGKKGLKYATDRDIAVVIMEPLRGGQLAEDPPEEAVEKIKEAGVDRTPADLALQWLWNQEEVGTVLSGMSNMQQVKENVASAANSGVDKLSSKELDLIDDIAEIFRGPIQCTQCNYCMPCPTGVNIPRNFSLYNHAHVHRDFEDMKERYQKLDDKEKASACIRCGQCEPSCPQNLDIMDLLEKVSAYFA